MAAEQTADPFPMRFLQQLQCLPDIGHLAALMLRSEQGELVGTITHQPGQSGSLAVYHALAQQHGGWITPQAAELGLVWYAEHTADAIANPGKHPNIDRLVQWAAGSVRYQVQTIPKEA